MTAVFYSLHHAGFQPEFLKLFFVGIMYVSVFYITKNIFSIFPFFWGVGAIWDVLINSEAGKQIENIQSFYIAIGHLSSGHPQEQPQPGRGEGVPRLPDRRLGR